MTLRILTSLLCTLLLCREGLLADAPASDLLKKPDEWFFGDEGKEALACILSWQSDHGDWPKNKDTTTQRYLDDRKRLKGTFDNGSTVGELRVLARAFTLTKQETYRSAFVRGLDHIFLAQFPNGGWPQYFPLSTKYHRHITFNDGAMVQILELLRDIPSEDDFDFLDDERRTLTHQAMRRGVDCIVNCQIVVDEKPTVWCAQHDEVTLKPTKGRSYERPSLSGSESAGILRFLMSLDQPSIKAIESVHHGVAWFRASSISGYRYQRSGTKTNLTADPSARLLWARFYEIESNRPIFCDRDGIIRYDVEQIGAERRGGYTWYGHWGQTVLNTYSKWAHRDDHLPLQ